MDCTSVFIRSGGTHEETAQAVARRMGWRIEPREDREMSWTVPAYSKPWVDIYEIHLEDDFGIEFESYPLCVSVSTHDVETRRRLAREVFEAVRDLGYPAILVENVQALLDRFDPPPK